MELFREVCENITHVSKSSFAADILERTGLFRVLKNIRLLQKEDLDKHCKEPYQWSDGLRPGDVIGMKVQVASENDKLKVSCTKENIVKTVLMIL